MSAPFCARCSAGDAICERGPDNLCAACAEDWDAATMVEFAAVLEAAGEKLDQYFNRLSTDGALEYQGGAPYPVLRKRIERALATARKLAA